MRVALLHPSYWPEVRRGGERLVHDAARGLARRGHDVTILTSHRARTTVEWEEGVRVVRSYRPPTKLMHRRAYEYHLTNVPAALARTARGGYDVAHAFFVPDAWAAVRARALGGPPVVYSFLGIPTREWIVAHRYRMPMVTTAVERAAAVTVLSEAAAVPFRRFLLRDPVVVPGSVAMGQFSVQRPPPSPTLICAASLSDPRKRGELLLSAFATLRGRRPDARLVLAGRRDPHQGETAFDLPQGAEWIDAADDATLAKAYAGAGASVLPSVDEAFGLVVIESLAAGTPAVGARSGALPELLSDPGVGRLFDPDDEQDLVRAMEEVVDLGAQPETAERCRRHAAAYDEDAVVARYEALYEQALR